MATKNVRSKVKEMNENRDGFHSANNSSTGKEEVFATRKSKTSSGKGDYIDFEEIK